LREKLASEFNEIVTENAYDNPSSTQPQPVEYLLLKDRAKPATRSDGGS
jgi:hypothetical protein